MPAVARAPDRRLRVFVSASLGELAAERASARAAIESLRLVPVLLDMNSGAHERHTTQGEVEQCDIFVGIYWRSYGASASGEISILEEQLWAADDRPRLIYVKEPSSDRDPRLTALIERTQQAGVAIRQISGSDDLAERLTDDIADLLSARFGSPTETRPVGTVTFLFADVERSTEALERLGDVFSHLLGRFRRDSETFVTDAGGTVVQTEGDGIFAVFAQATGALEAAISAQHAFLSYPPPGPIRVRIGLHSGAGVVVDGNYTGIDVHRAARIGAAAHGGQILISAPSRELIRTWNEVTVTDLGWFELKGLSRPEHLYQATVPGLPASFPPLRARPSFRAGLPRELTPLFGRESDIATISLLLGSNTRLLTLTGPGGIGKTRLALAVARRVEGRYRDGVGFVALAAVTDPEQVDVTIVMGLGRTVEGTASAEDVIVDELRERQFLLVLDNFEQVVDRGPLLRSLLERLPQLQILVTSRIALQLSVEREYGVTPLQLPESGARFGDVVDAAAVRLLLDRARAVRPDLAVTADNAEAIAELVRRLDGIPLAIELAAARLRLLEPADFLSRLRSALDLGSGAVDLPPRQRTLRAAIDSSYDLLAPSEQLLFGRLGIFVDGWTLAAAEEVTGDAGAAEVAAALDTLAAHSLIQLETLPGAGVRMRLLVPLQDYSRALLDESGDLETIRARHAGYYAGIVEGYPRGTGVGLADWRARMDAEWGNIQQAILWCADRPDYPVLARFLVSLWPLLWQEDRVDETLGWLGVLRPHLDELEPSLRAEAFHIDGFFALEAGDFERALEGARQAMEAAAALGDEELEARSRLLVAGILPAFDFGDPRIPELIVEAIGVFRNRGDTVNLAYALNFLGSYQAGTGELAEARKAVEEAILLSASIEALPIGAQSSSLAAFVELISGDLDRAKVHLDDARTALAVTPSREVLCYILDGYGWWALAKGREIEGLSALGAAEGLRARIGLRVWPLATIQISLLAQMADSYEDPQAQAARRAGRELTPDVAFALAVGSPEPP